jgi:hypothetical protein
VGLSQVDTHRSTIINAGMGYQRFLSWLPSYYSKECQREGQGRPCGSTESCITLRVVLVPTKVRLRDLDPTLS